MLGVVTEANKAVGSVLNKVPLENDQAVNIDDSGEVQLAKATAGNTETAEAAITHATEAGFCCIARRNKNRRRQRREA